MDSDLERLCAGILDSIDAKALEAQVRAVIEGQDEIVVPNELLDDLTGELTQEQTENLYAIIKDMPIPGKIKLALFGNQTARTLLIRDTNKQIPQFVLKNARITENEILEMARNSNLDEAVHRGLANNPSWMKSYAIKLAIVSNPKVPIDISLRWVKHIQEKDLRRLSKSKNIPQVIASQCRKLLEKREG